VAFMILPLFAFANAGVSLRRDAGRADVVLPLGIIAGLFIGKPLGISLFCWLALKLKLASLPKAPPLSRLWRSACCAGLALRCRSLSRRWRLARMP
jgi:NhaA family Na+:H+ antiporter